MQFFTTRRLADDITLIAETGVAPWLRCNIWHVRGRDRDLVIDTGMGLTPLKAEVARLSDRPLTAVITHSHFDHAAGLHEFDDRRGHPLEDPVMKIDGPAASVLSPAWTAAQMIDPRVYPEFRPKEYVVRAAPLTGHLDEGDVIDLGDRAFNVLHLPGHSQGSIGLWEPATATLFSGDAIYDGGMLDQLPDSDPQILRASHERMCALQPEVVHGGHFASFGAERLSELVAEYRAGGLRIDDFDAWMAEQRASADW